ncbi:MAG TPA: hypothetical protein VF473_03125 [Cyclobacteriaceae bacterium]
MKGLLIALAFITLLLTAGCNGEKIPFKNSSPGTITEFTGPRPRYYWRQGRWVHSSKANSDVWRQGKWVHKRKHTKWVEGRWVETARGKMYLEGHWE